MSTQCHWRPLKSTGLAVKLAVKRVRVLAMAWGEAPVRLRSGRCLATDEAAQSVTLPALQPGIGATIPLRFEHECGRLAGGIVMPHWVPLHADGRFTSVDADLVTELRAVDPHNVDQGSILTLRDGSELRVDEAVAVLRLVLGQAG